MWLYKKGLHTVCENQIQELDFHGSESKMSFDDFAETGVHVICANECWRLYRFLWPAKINFWHLTLIYIYLSLPTKTGVHAVGAGDQITVF